MNRLPEDKIVEIILDAMRQLNLAREESQQVEVSPDAEIFPAGGRLDSLGLVALLIDIEQALAERGFAISLSDDRAVSQQRSPFRNVPSLVAYVSQSIELNIKG
jgi:acyl carrier protein